MRICRGGEAMPFKQAWRPVFHLPSSLSAQLLAKKKHSKQSFFGSRTPFFIEQSFSSMVFIVFLLLWDERPAGNYAGKTIQRPSLAWDFGLAWWHEGSGRAHPARVFLMFLSMKSIWGSGRKVANTICAIRYIVSLKNRHCVLFSTYLSALIVTH